MCASPNEYPTTVTNVPVDIAPEPLRLDQVSVDNVIASIVETEELENDLTVDETESKLAAGETVTVEPLPDPDEPVVKGAMKTRTYALKRNT